jgi:hypothetical protein
MGQARALDKMYVDVGLPAERCGSGQVGDRVTLRREFLELAEGYVRANRSTTVRGVPLVVCLEVLSTMRHS